MSSQTFNVNQQVTMAGFAFTVVMVCTGALSGMYVVRNRSGSACVSGSDLLAASA